MFKNFQKEFEYQFTQKPIMNAPYNLQLFWVLSMTLHQNGYDCKMCGRSATYYAFPNYLYFDLFLHSGSNDPKSFGGISLFDLIIEHELFVAVTLCKDGAVTFYTVNNINE